MHEMQRDHFIVDGHLPQYSSKINCWSSVEVNVDDLTAVTAGTRSTNMLTTHWPTSSFQPSVLCFVSRLTIWSSIGPNQSKSYLPAAAADVSSRFATSGAGEYSSRYFYSRALHHTDQSSVCQWPRLWRHKQVRAVPARSQNSALSCNE